MVAASVSVASWRGRQRSSLRARWEDMSGAVFRQQFARVQLERGAIGVGGPEHARIGRLRLERVDVHLHVPGERDDAVVHLDARTRLAERVPGELAAALRSRPCGLSGHISSTSSSQCTERTPAPGDGASSSAGALALISNGQIG